MDYSGTMRRGWEILWQNKWLVLLTLLPSLVSGLGSMLIYGASPVMMDPYTAPEQMLANTSGLLLIYCLSLIIALVAGILYLAGQGGQFAAVARLSRGEATSFGASFREGLRALPRLLALAFLVYGVPLILLVAAVLAFLVPVSVLTFSGEMSGDSGGVFGVLGLVGLCCVYLVYLLAIIVAAGLYAFGGRGIVLRGLGVFEAIRHGWRVLRQNLGQVLLLALPFVIIMILLFIALYAVLTILLFRSVGTFPMMPGSGVLLLATLAYLLPAVVLYAWQSSTVTLAYLKWTGKDVLGAGAPPPAAPPLV